MLCIQPKLINLKINIIGKTQNNNQNLKSSNNKITFGFRPYFLDGTASERLHPETEELLNAALALLKNSEKLVVKNFNNETVSLFKKEKINSPYLLVHQKDDEIEQIGIFKFNKAVFSKLSPKDTIVYKYGDLNKNIQKYFQIILSNKK